MKEEEKKTIYCISTIRKPDKCASSTHIMTSALLKGLSKSNKVILLAICEYDNEMEEIKEYYSNIVDTVIPLKSRFKSGKNNLIIFILNMFYSFFYGFYKRNAKKYISNFIATPDLFISFVPSLETVFYARVFRKYFQNTKYYQYWSDPVVLAGITPQQIGIKRKLFFIIEKRALQYAERVIYGTKTLMYFQKILYPSISQKMHYVDVPYLNYMLPAKIDCEKNKTQKCKLLYAGDYFRSIRNIKPLLDAMVVLPNYTLDIYGDGDISDPGLPNIKFYNRVSPNQLAEIQRQYEYEICILNHTCIQIPGKIFYGMIKPCKILVISDGAYSDIIRDYLQTYRRFIFCENNADDIRKAIVESVDTPVDIQYIKENYNAEKIASALVLGGYGEYGICGRDR